MVFDVVSPAEFVFQVVPARSAGIVDDEQLVVAHPDGSPAPVQEIHDHHRGRLHLVTSPPGQLSVSYEGSVRLAHGDERRWTDSPASREYERQAFLRPSRYCPTDRLMGFALTEFGTGPVVGPRVTAIREWIRRRIEYLPGSGSVHDSAEHTLLTGRGSCRDFAHLGVALCRATGIPARFVAVYAPGLDPMDFHAVFEVLDEGRWLVHDATGLAPRQSMVRIATGRDAADTAFAAVNGGIAELEGLEVSAVVDPGLPLDYSTLDVELA